MYINERLSKYYFKILIITFFLGAFSIGIYFFTNRIVPPRADKQQLEQQTKQTLDNQSEASLESFNVNNGFFEATSSSLAYVEIRATQNDKPADDTNKDVWIADMIQEGEGDDRQHWKLAVASCFGPYHTIYAVGRDRYLKPAGVIELPAHDSALRDYVCDTIHEPKDWITAKYIGYLDVPRWWPQIQITYKDGNAKLIGRLYGYKVYEPLSDGLENKFGKEGDDIMAGGIVLRHFAGTIADRAIALNNQYNQLCDQPDTWTSGRLTWTRLRCHGTDKGSITEYNSVKDPSLAWGTVELSFVTPPPVLKKTYERIIKSFSFFRTKKVATDFLGFIIPEDYSLINANDSGSPAIIIDINGKQTGLSISHTIIRKNNNTDGFNSDGLDNQISYFNDITNDLNKYVADISHNARTQGAIIKETTMAGGPAMLITYANGQRELVVYRAPFYLNNGVGIFIAHIASKTVIDDPRIGSLFDMIMSSLEIFEL